MGQNRLGDRPLTSYVLLYGLMYAAFGVASPFWPQFFAERGLGSEQLAGLLALGTAARLVSGPLAGGLADRLSARRVTLALCIGLSGSLALGLLAASDYPTLLLVSLCHAAALAPVTTLADALATRQGIGSAVRFEYGWVRGAGSAAFVVGTIVAGQAVSFAGLRSVVVFHSGLLLMAALVALVFLRGTSADATAQPASSSLGGFATLLHIPLFRRLLLVAALILGSHAMHDAFAVIRWSAAGIGPGLASMLWSLSVVGEVLVFFLIGPPLLARVGSAWAAAIAGAAATLRWTTMALTSDPIALALVQPLHGLTFALLHLACMRLMVQVVPARLVATGQALYALGVAAATALVTLLAGALYARFGAAAFFAMASLSAVALPLTPFLRGARSPD